MNKQINTKPFWKEPTLNHVWARAKPGAKLMILTFGFLVSILISVVISVNNIVPLWVVSLIDVVIGFRCGQLFQQVWKDEDK